MTQRGEEYVQVSVRVPAKQVEALERLAAQEERTISAEIRRLIRLHVMATEPQPFQNAA